MLQGRLSQGPHNHHCGMSILVVSAFRLLSTCSPVQTHNVSMVSKVAQYVISLSLDGRVISQGTLAEALSRDSKLLAKVAKENKLQEKKAEVIDPPEEGEKISKKDGKLVVAEEVALGRVSWPARE
jgi:hypothetical protein